MKKILKEYGIITIPTLFFILIPFFISCSKLLVYVFIIGISNHKTAFYS